MKHPPEVILLLLLQLHVGCAAPAPATGCEPSSVPRLEGHVTDYASVLSAPEHVQLTGLLEAYKVETHHEVAVLILKTTCGEPIEAFSLRAANAWGIGAKEFDDGILVVLAIDDKQARIELGLGMERYIPDAAAKDIMDGVMVPAFREGLYSAGLEAGLRRLMDDGRKYVVPPEQR